MQTTVRVIRAIASLFAWRIFIPIAIFVGIMALVLIVVMVWLVMLDPLWWLLAIPVFLLIIIATTVLTVIWVVLRLIAPGQTKTQKQQVSGFVDKIQRLSEVTVTPKFVLLFRTVKDVVAPSKDGFIEGVIGDTASLKKDFQALQQEFRD